MPSGVYSRDTAAAPIMYCGGGEGAEEAAGLARGRGAPAAVLKREPPPRPRPGPPPSRKTTRRAETTPKKK